MCHQSASGDKMTGQRQQGRDEWVRFNTCRFCMGSHLHSCTGYDCKDAIKQAKEEFDKMNRWRVQQMDNIKRGEIFYISRGVASCGSEQQADRPAVVVSNDRNNENSTTVEVVYLTTQPKTDLPTHAVIRSTGRISTVLCEQIHTVAVERVVKYIGQCSDKEMENIDIALMISLSLDAGTKTAKKYLEDSIRQQEEIDNLREQLASAKEDAAKRQQMQDGQPHEVYATEEQVIKRASEDIVRIETQRDTYRAMYEALLSKVIES